MRCNATWLGGSAVHEALSDTGPVLHIHEIECSTALCIFDRLALPELVAEELRAYHIEPTALEVLGLEISIHPVERETWAAVMTHHPQLHPADAQIVVLALQSPQPRPVLTDDLALRKHLEHEGITVVGTVGLLIRAYTVERLTRPELEGAIDKLFTQSTLYLSRAFRTYIRHLIRALP